MTYKVDLLTWFEQLFGFREQGWQTTREAFVVADDRLIVPNGSSFGIGRFSTPSLAELRSRGQAVGRVGRLQRQHEAIGDVLALHGQPQNHGAMFQVASQFNCLEFASPQMVPEDGVTVYRDDPTQGPACALAAAAATIYRNYFAPDGAGQRRDRQINNLSDVLGALSPPRELRVINGYTEATDAALASVRDALTGEGRSALRDKVRIGLQTQVEVTFVDRFLRPDPSQPVPVVSQAFCSAASCAYSSVTDLDAWEPLATLVLEAAYEATLWAAIIDGAKMRRSPKVWLTFLGGGVFGNRAEWIAQAIRRALDAVDGCDITIYFGHYGQVDHELARMIDEA